LRWPQRGVAFGG
jgi:hypothetical protein